LLKLLAFKIKNIVVIITNEFNTIIDINLVLEY